MAYKDKATKTRKQNEFIAKAYDRINLTVKKGHKEIIQINAQECGMSVNAYINKAIDILMNNGGSFGISEAGTDTNHMSRSISHATLFAETELEKISGVLSNGQTIDDYIRSAVLAKLKADSKNKLLINDDDIAVTHATFQKLGH